MKTSVFVEHYGKKVETRKLEERVKEIWKEQGGKIKDILFLELYYKPEENMCYYVINGTKTGGFTVND